MYSGRCEEKQAHKQKDPTQIWNPNGIWTLKGNSTNTSEKTLRKFETQMVSGRQKQNNTNTSEKTLRNFETPAVSGR